MAAGDGWGLLSGARSSLGRLCRGGKGDSRHKPCDGGKLLMTWCGPAAPDACWESGGRSPEVTDQMSLTEKGGNVPCGKTGNVHAGEIIRDCKRGHQSSQQRWEKVKLFWLFWCPNWELDWC